MVDRHRILVVQSDPSISRHQREALETAGFGVEHAETGHAALRRLRMGGIDLVLISHYLPDMSSTEIVAWLVSRSEATPIIVTATADTEPFAIEMLKSGATDYVIIEPANRDLNVLVRVAHMSIRQHALVGENHRLLQQTRLNRQSFLDLFRTIGEPCFLFRTSRDGDVVLVEINNAGVDLLDRPRDELIETPLESFPIQEAEVVAGIYRPIEGERPHWERQLLHETDEGGEQFLLIRCVRLGDDTALLTVSDATETRKLEEQLREWRERCEQLTGVLADYVFTVRVEKGQPAETIHSPACAAVTGYTSAEFAADPYLWINMVVPEDRERVRQQASDLLLGRNVHPVEHRIRHKDGVARWVKNTPVPHFGANGNLLSYDGLVQDITGRKEAEVRQQRNEELFRTLSGFSSDFIFWQNPDGKLLYVSPACRKVTGYTAEEFRNDPALMDQIVHPLDRPQWQEHRQATTKGDTHESMEFRIVTKEGETRWVSHSCRPVHDETGRFRGIRGSNRDITERKESEERLKAYAAKIEEANRTLEQQQHQLKAQQEDLLQANRNMERLAKKLAIANSELNVLVRIDPLTQLLNRRAWEEHANQEQQRAMRGGPPFGIIMLDVDHFKTFNDTRGHPAGDECLVQVARSLMATCRAVDHVGRYGGEEFIILAPDTGKDEALQLAERVRDAICAMNLPHPSSPTADRVTVSVGVVASNGEALEKVIKRADDAMYAAKHTGRNRVMWQGAPSHSRQGAANEQGGTGGLPTRAK